MAEFAILYPASGTPSAAQIRTSITRLNRMAALFHTPLGAVAILFVLIEVDVS